MFPVVQDVRKLGSFKFLNHVNDGTSDSAEYEAAVEMLYGLHLCRLKPWPSEVDDSPLSPDVLYCYRLCVGCQNLSKTKKNRSNDIKKDATMYMTMSGHLKFLLIGSLRGWVSEENLISHPSNLVV